LLCIGSILDYVENKWDGKHFLAFFIVQGAGNCRLGYYPSFIRDVIKKKRLKNVATIELMHEEGFAGLGPDFSLRGIQTLIISDVLDDIRSAIMAYAVDSNHGLSVFNQEFEKLLNLIEKKPEHIYKGLKKFANAIRQNIPSKIRIDDAKYIALVGEMYVRRDHFAHKWLNKYFASKGFVVKDAYISEWIFYVDYLLKKGLYEPLKSFKNKYERLLRITYMRYAEYRIKKILEKSGYYKFHLTRIEPLVNHGKHIVPLEFKGEPLLILGTGIYDSIDKYCGIVSVGPFGCMQTRFAEAITLPEMNTENKIAIKKKYDPDYKLPSVFNGNTNIPFLSIETDGNVYPQLVEAKLESFSLQAERIAELINISKNKNGKLKI
jgi:predicted nucleotide-binding protein (sugar kinase/HSP70/actin superfamily)